LRGKLRPGSPCPPGREGFRRGTSRLRPIPLRGGQFRLRRNRESCGEAAAAHRKGKIPRFLAGPRGVRLFLYSMGYAADEERGRGSGRGLLGVVPIGGAAFQPHEDVEENAHHDESEIEAAKNIRERLAHAAMANQAEQDGDRPHNIGYQHKGNDPDRDAAGTLHARRPAGTRAAATSATAARARSTSAAATS